MTKTTSVSSQYSSWKSGMVEWEFPGAGLETRPPPMVYYWEGKIFENPSRYGINKGRVSKLRVWRAGLFLRSIPVDVFCYDREPGLDFLPPGILERILEQIKDD